jgi:anhydro-N-acetylmuramic acid kinase
LVECLLRNSAPETSSVEDISQLNALLPILYADAVIEALKGAHLSLSDLDLVGCHGQTVFHIPTPQDCVGFSVRSSLQIGDASVLANRLNVPVVADFRTADMALGGQGAPLVPYLDYVYFTSSTENRGLLNLGGIGNITVLPANATPEQVFAFDTGPANMVIDDLMRRFYGKPYDENGDVGASGKVNEALLAELLDDPFFSAPPPKSTGREKYTKHFADGLIANNPHISPEDLVATATAFTAHSVLLAYHNIIRPLYTLDVIVASGGGIHNATLMRMLADVLSPIRVTTANEYNLDSDAKEAVCFAVLAHEYVNGVPTNLPSVTGASRPTLLGKLCLSA